MQPSVMIRSASNWSLYDAVPSEDATSMWTLPALGVPRELGVRTGNLGVGEIRESEDESPCPPPSALWLDGPLSIARWRGEAAVARAAATLCVASWCGCACEVEVAALEVDSPRVIDVPGDAEEDVAIARRSQAQPHRSEAVRLITCSRQATRYLLGAVGRLGGLLLRRSVLRMYMS